MEGSSRVSTSSRHLCMCTSVIFKDLGKPWFCVSSKSGNLRNWVLMSISFAAPACREAKGLPKNDVCN